MKHRRLIAWLLLWLIPLPLLPEQPVVPLYWLALLLMVGYAFRVPLILEPRWTIDDELDQIRSWT